MIYVILAPPIPYVLRHIRDSTCCWNEGKVLIRHTHTLKTTRTLNPACFTRHLRMLRRQPSNTRASPPSPHEQKMVGAKAVEVNPTHLLPM